MNTSALKSFAPAVRNELIEAITRKLDFVLTGDTADLRAASAQRDNLRRQATKDRTGLIERVAYTWFNRFAALRFIDARDWHPFRARVITPTSPEESQPELLKRFRSGEMPEDLKAHTNPTRLNDLLDGRIPSPDAQGEVYRQLILATCRFYHQLLPDLFEKLDDETELLLPDDLLTEHSVVHGFRTEITDADCAEVEILGWLYQFYISEKKDAVMARKSAVPTEDIPAVTQLFTPHWIVRYLVENSLGRLWLLNRPQSKLREHMPYYIDGETETDFLQITKPEDIRLCDPAVGSGHMLTYAFDLLFLIYEEEGHAPSEIAGKILSYNLHGLEICPRAAQLAELALVLKAREKFRRFFQSEHLVRPRIIELRDIRFAENEISDYIHALGLGNDLFSQPVLKLLQQFEEAKNFGSLIQPCLDARTIADVSRAIEAKDLGGQLFLRETHLKVLRVLEQAEALTQRYHVVVANPPYMGAGNMNAKLKHFATSAYSLAKADLSSMFVERSLSLLRPQGIAACITMHNWMFLSSFEAMREQLIELHQIESCVHIGYNSFPELNSKVVQAAAFTICRKAPRGKGVYYNLNAAAQSADKEEVFKEQLATGKLYLVSNAEFRSVPGSPIAYWMSAAVRQLFATAPRLGDFAPPKIGMRTGNNERFLRLWHEVASDKFSPPENNASPNTRLKWIPYNKGGGFRKWYGNFDFVVNWEGNGEEIKANTLLHYPQLTADNLGWKISNETSYFKEGITWTDLSTSFFGVRYLPNGFIFDAAGPCVFGPKPLLYLAFLATKQCYQFLLLLNPTFHFKNYNIASLPFVVPSDEKACFEIARECVQLGKIDWDNFETSWDFRDPPLLRSGLKGATLEESWRNWETQSTAAIRRMQELETENNRLFIAAYGLDGELQPDVPEEQITLARPDQEKDMKAFLSYALGCMMGRYSLDHPGLILANTGDTLAHYLAKVGKTADQLSFVPDEDGIIPVLDGEWFEDDIVARTRDFLRATFGPDTLNENLRFFEDALGKDLRKYFLTDFYKDHLQTYKKRPIYWMVQSPKRGFSVLIYLQRYTKDTLNGVLNRYLRDYQVKLRNHLAHLDQVQASAGTAKAKTDARKESEKLNKILRECEDWERQVLLPLAQQRIELDLDDGVKTNYLKLAEALAPIPGLAAKEDE